MLSLESLCDFFFSIEHYRERMDWPDKSRRASSILAGVDCSCQESLLCISIGLCGPFNLVLHLQLTAILSVGESISPSLLFVA